MYTGFAIVLAWPETFCKQAGGWYDGLMDILRISKNNYYKVGHAAVVLVETNTGRCHYFDFGRYHAPFGHGRIRDSETDHDLIIMSKAQLSDWENEILNINDLLTELFSNSACHGSGPLHASYANINFEKAYLFAKDMQNKSPWKYGPFVWNGTNCSRFVRTVVLAGTPPLFNKLRLYTPLTFSPTPIGNVRSFKNKIIINKVTCPTNKYCLFK